MLWIKLQNIDFKNCKASYRYRTYIKMDGVSQGLVHCLCFMDICVYGACATV